MKRVVSILLCVCVSLGLKAMRVIPDSLSVQDVFLESIVGHLDMDGVETGILYDAGYTPVDYRSFDGTYTCSYSSDFSVFYSILKGVKSSVVNSSAIVPVADSVMSFMSNYLDANSRVPVGIAVYDYNEIASNAIASGSLGFQMVNNEIVLENVQLPDGSLADPYEVSTFAAFSPYVNIVPCYVTFDFSNSFRFTNRIITALQFDPGDGSGFHSISSNGTYTVNYSVTPDIKTIKVKVTLDGNEQLYAKSIVRVFDSYSYSGGSSDPIFRWSVETRTSEIESDGVYPKAIISVRYANGSSFSKQPIIVSEGFEPLSDPIGLFLKGDHAHPGYGFNNIDSFSSKLSTTVLNNHDIVYIDRCNSTCSIQSNADLLMQVIEWVNERKPVGQRSILIGQSMGGLIARYALRQMEQNADIHEVSTFVSNDAPHLGVNIPLGYLYMAQLLFDLAIIRESNPLLGLGDYILLLEPILNSTNYSSLYRSEILSLRNGTGVKQMLKYYVNPLLTLDTSQFDSFQQTLNTIGFPHGDSGYGILNLCISNGGVNGFVNSDSPLLGLKRHYYSSSPYLVLSHLVNSILSGNLSSMMGPNLFSIDEEIGVKPFTETSDTLFYYKRSFTKQFSWGNPYTVNDFEIPIFAPSSIIPMDTVNGSYYPIDIPQWLTPGSTISDVLEDLGIDFYFQDRFVFVPTVSSLCHNDAENHLKSNFASTGLNFDDIPFDGYRFHASSASYHTQVNSADIDFVCAMDGIQVLDSLTTSGNRQYYVNKPGVSVVWSSSNTSVANINAATGVVSAVGYGSTTIYANVSYLGGTLRLKKTLNLPPPSNVEFLSYSLRVLEMMQFDYSPYDEYTISANTSGTYPDEIIPYIKYCWGRKINGQSTITWTEGTSRSYYVSLHQSDDRYIYFRVKYLNTYSTTYSVRCRPIPRIVPVDPLGNLYTEDMGEIIVQVKGDAQGQTITFTCLGIDVLFDTEPTLAELCRRLLDYNVFVTEVKRLKPWGNEDVVMIPYSYTVGDSVEPIQDLIVFKYDSNIQ